MRYLIIIPILGFLCSCSQSVDLEFQDVTAKTKIMAVFSPGNPIEFKISQTTNLDFPELEQLVFDAEIQLFHFDQLVDVIHPNPDQVYISEFSDYQYGDTLRFSMTSTENDLIVSETVIPPKLIDPLIRIDTMPLIKLDQGYYVNVEVSFKDPENTDNYYELEVWEKVFPEREGTLAPDDFWQTHLDSDDPIITQEGYYPPFPFIVSMPGLSLPFSDITFDGEHKTMKFQVFTTMVGMSMGDGFILIMIPAKDIAVHFKSITREQYLFKTSLMRHLLARKSDIIFGSGNPVNIVGNIQGGLGLFSCETIVSDTVHIEKKEIHQ